MATPNLITLVPVIEFIFPDGFTRRRTLFQVCRGTRHNGQRPVRFRFNGVQNVRVTAELVHWAATEVIPALAHYDRFFTAVAYHQISPDLAPQIQAHPLKRKDTNVI
jgi:hypothetical protein